MMKSLPLLLILCYQLENIYPTGVINSPCFPWDTTCLGTLGQSIGHNIITRVPELETYKLDPYEVDYFKIERDGLELETRATQIHGLRNMIIDEFSANYSTNFLRAKFRTDILVTGLYKASGSMLFMPISGEGDYSISFKNVEVDVHAPFRVIKNAHGEVLLEVLNSKFDYDVKDNAEFRLNNLCYGFSGLSEMLHFLINYNWKYVSSQYAKDFMANAVEDMDKNYKSYFRLEPLKFILQ